MKERLAFDSSNRTVDRYGHLNVASSNITREAVNQYLGIEIPKYRELGLDPNKLYWLYRDPAELKRAASTFNGKPLLIEHTPLTAADHAHELTVGSVNNVDWSDPYLTGELSVWDASAIAGIQSGDQKELSAAYGYDAIMQPGVAPDGTPYDGRMVNIHGNHVALVPSGRAGSDVVVGDAALGSPRMPKQLSRMALLAAIQVKQAVKPKLAQDAKIDWRKLVEGVTVANYKASKPKIKIALDAAVNGKLAKDADIDDVVELLDKLDDVSEELAPELADAAPADPNPKPAEDGTLTPEEEAELARLLAKKGTAQDAVPPVPPKKDPPVPAKKDPPAMDSVSQVAMDAAIAKTKTDTEAATIKRMVNLSAAQRFVQPWVGELDGAEDKLLAMDSATDVYKLALELLEVDIADVHPSAYRAVLNAQPKPLDPTPSQTNTIAMDAGTLSGLAKRFPGMAALKHR